MTSPVHELIAGVTIHKAGGYQVAFKGRSLMYFKAEMLPLAVQMRREAEQIVADDPDVDLDVMVGVLRMKYSELKIQFEEGGALLLTESGTSAPNGNGDHDHPEDIKDEPAPNAQPDLPEPLVAELTKPIDVVETAIVATAPIQFGHAIPQPPTYVELLRAALDADTAYAETRLTLDLAQERHDAAKAVAMEAWSVFFREIDFWKGDPRHSALSLTKGWRSPDGA